MEEEGARSKRKEEGGRRREREQAERKEGRNFSNYSDQNSPSGQAAV